MVEGGPRGGGSPTSKAKPSDATQEANPPNLHPCILPHQRMQGQLDEAKAKELGLVQQAFATIETQAKVLNLAKENGIIVSDQEVAQALQEIQMLQDNGQFSKEFYERFLTSQRMTAKTFEEKLDLNTATANQLQRVNGIGKTLSERIIKFRNSFSGGFISDIQLQDVYGLSPEVIERLTNEFTVKTPRQINKFNINIATTEQLVTIQHIDYELAYEIINQRTLREGFKSLDELLKVQRCLSK